MIWFTADQHFWHKNIIKYCNRPFDNIEEMNDVIIQNYNNYVKPNDVTYFLGDFGLSSKDKMTSILTALNGYKILIKGNHDRYTKTKALSIGFDAYYKKRLRIGSFYLTHRPKYDINKIVLCGHVHEKWQVRRNCINVGVDVWDFKPVSMERIRYEAIYCKGYR